MKSPDLFLPIVAADRMHPQFTELYRSPVHGSARTLMNDLLGRMGDPNGRFTRDFQSDGFHSRLFELACFAYLEHAGRAIDRTHARPDFLVSAHGWSLAVEAVTSNPATGQATDISLRKMIPLSETEIFEKVIHEIPSRIGKSLHKKLRHRYHELPHCRDKPLVFMIAPFFEAGSVFYTDDSLIHLLYGAPGGANKVYPFFQREEAETVSGVLYCNQFTVSRFFRMSTEFSEVGALEVTRYGVCLRNRGSEHYSIEEFSYVIGSPNAPKETWAEGVTIFENPNARIPLPTELLPSSSRVSVRDGYLFREVNDFHPVASFTQIHAGGDPAEEQR